MIHRDFAFAQVVHAKARFSLAFIISIRKGDREFVTGRRMRQNTNHESFNINETIQR